MGIGIGGLHPSDRTATPDDGEHTIIIGAGKHAGNSGSAALMTGNNQQLGIKEQGQS